MPSFFVPERPVTLFVKKSQWYKNDMDYFDVIVGYFCFFWKKQEYNRQFN